MTRYFETQMQNMMKDFFNFGFNHDSVIGENYGGQYLFNLNKKKIFK